MIIVSTPGPSNGSWLLEPSNGRTMLGPGKDLDLDQELDNKTNVLTTIVSSYFTFIRGGSFNYINIKFRMDF